MNISSLVVLTLAALPISPPDTVVVCPGSFRLALRPWVEHRQSQGHVIAIISDFDGKHPNDSEANPTADRAEEIRRQIRVAASHGKLKHIVLVGDAEPNPLRDAAVAARCVPTHHAKAKVNVAWGSEPHIATDNWYADLDDDHVPDVAVGRLTADTPEDLRRIVAKILAYERSTDFGPWRRRLSFVAGVGGFGAVADMVIESTATHLLTQNIPAEYRMSMTYGSWRSPYCPDPREFHTATMATLGEGAWFWVYIGHGYHLGLDRVRVPGGNHHILGVPDIPKLKLQHGPPIAMFLACYTGAFDASADCLAERMLAEPNGPIAVYAGSRVTMPYAMTVMATGLMDQCFQQRPETLGQAILEAKRAMVRPADPRNRQRALIDTIAAVVSPARDKLTEERAEHLLLFNLIGDPLLRLRYPEQVEIEVPATVAPGNRLAVSGTSSLDGVATVELVVRRDRLTFAAPPRREFPSTSEGLAAFQRTYERANDRRLASAETPIRQGKFSLDLPVPSEAYGPCHVRLYVASKTSFASGSADVEIVTAEE